MHQLTVLLLDISLYLADVSTMHMLYSTAPCCSHQPLLPAHLLTNPACCCCCFSLSSPLDPYPQAPKNPITGEPLTPVTNKDKEGYQASTLAGQSEDTHARIMGQLDAQPGGRSFGGEALFTGWPAGTAVVLLTGLNSDDVHCLTAACSTMLLVPPSKICVRYLWLFCYGYVWGVADNNIILPALPLLPTCSPQRCRPLTALALR
jgi:hypothetical protein